MFWGGCCISPPFGTHHQGTAGVGQPVRSKSAERPFDGTPPLPGPMLGLSILETAGVPVPAVLSVSPNRWGKMVSHPTSAGGGYVWAASRWDSCTPRQSQSLLGAQPCGAEGAGEPGQGVLGLLPPATKGGGGGSAVPNPRLQGGCGEGVVAPSCLLHRLRAIGCIELAMLS